MDFRLSAEHSIIRDSIREQLAFCLNGIARSGRILDDSAVAARSLWDTAVEMGWPGIMIGENAGGSNVGLVGAALLMEELGRALAPGPFLTNALLLPGLLGNSSVSIHKELLSGIVAGDRIACLGLGIGEPTTAAQVLCEYPGLASDMVVIRSGTEDHLKMRCLHAKDLSFKPRMSFDIYEPLAEFSADVTGAGPDEHGQLPETGLAPFLVGASAELMGIGERCLGETIQFVKERSQFGKRIGSYQSLKHRLADCYVEIENTRTAVHYAALSWDSKSADSWTSANIARAYSALTIPRVIEACVQAHGAFGFTWESGLHVMLRRARKRAALLYSGKRAQMMLEDRLACNDIGADLQV